MDETPTQQSLETKRLRLEPLTPRHADALYRIYTEPEVSQFLLNRPRSRAEFGAIFDRALQFAMSHGMWALFPRDGNALIGRVGFFAFGEEQRPELAFLLTRSALGTGLDTEACAAALRHALTRHAWSEGVALIRPGNGAAARVIEKLGFSPESDLAIDREPALLYQAPRERLEVFLERSG